MHQKIFLRLFAKWKIKRCEVLIYAFSSRKYCLYTNNRTQNIVCTRDEKWNTMRFLFAYFLQVSSKKIYIFYPHFSPTLSIQITSSVGSLEKQQRLDEQLFERLASLGIMWVQLRASLNPLGPSQHYRNERFKVGPQLVPHYADRRKPLRQRV